VTGVGEGRGVGCCPARVVERAGVPVVVPVVIEASFVPVVVVFVSCAETTAALARSASAITPNLETVLTVVFLPKKLMNTA
jgi:hypothetical protein